MADTDLESAVSSSPSKLERLRADQKAVVNFEPRQTLFGRPRSVSQPPAADGFSFGKVARKGPNLARTSAQQTQGDNSSSFDQHESSKTAEKRADLGLPARPALDLSTFDIRPLHIAPRAAPDVSNGSSKMKDIADAANITDTANTRTSQSLLLKEKPAVSPTPSKGARQSTDKGKRVMSQIHMRNHAAIEQYSEEDFLTLLLNRSRQRKSSNARAAEKQKQMAFTISQLCQANEYYQNQLKDVRELERAHAATMGEQRRASEDLKVKFAALKNFATGLTNDMESIRKDGDTIRKSQSQLVDHVKAVVIERANDIETLKDDLASSRREASSAQNLASTLKAEISRMKEQLKRKDDTKSQIVETPLRATQSVDHFSMPDSPLPPRQRRIAKCEIPESSLAVREKLATSKTAQHELSPGSQGTDLVLETQISQQNKDREEPSSELSDLPESSPTKAHQSSFRRTVKKPTKKSNQRSLPGITRKTQELSWGSQSSTQGEEMLLERQSQTGDPPPNIPADRPADSSLKPSRAHPDSLSGNTLPRELTPRQLRDRADSRARMREPLTEQPLSNLILLSSASPISPVESTLKGKNQPNSGAKRQLDSDAVTESSAHSPNKLLKRNPSIISTRKTSSTSVSFFDQVPGPASGTGADQRSHASLPAGSKKGSIGGKSGHGGDTNQKRSKKPRKGSRGDQYDNRFG